MKLKTKNVVLISEKQKWYKQLLLEDYYIYVNLAAFVHQMSNAGQWNCLLTG